MSFSIKNSSVTVDGKKAYEAYSVSEGLGSGKKNDDEVYTLAKTDTVTISITAIEISKKMSPSNQYVKFFPTTSGTPANNLGLGVTDPSAEPFSAGKDMDDVSKDARAELDSRYADFKKAGIKFNENPFEGKDWYELFKNLDRRALFAVRNDKNGLFTKDERDMAQSIMSQQEGLAMGLYSGPTSLEKYFVDPFGGDFTAQLKAHMDYLKKVSGDEKTSGAWVQDMVTTEMLHTYYKNKKDDKMEKEEDPILKLIKRLIEEERKNNQKADKKDNYSAYEELKNTDFFKAILQGIDGQIR